MKRAINTEHARPAVSDRLAACLASHILRLQARSADKISARFHLYSMRQRKWILLSFMSIVAGALFLGAASDCYKIPPLKQTYRSPTHIGQASGNPPVKLPQPLRTDSLTINH